MEAFKRAAQAAFERTYGGKAGRPADVERLSVDVQIDGRHEIVSLLFRSGELTWSCTCAQSECPHARAALAFVCDAEAAPHEDRITEVWEPATAAAVGAATPIGPSDRRTVMHSDQASLADRPALAEILQDLVVAVVRAGVGAGASAALDEGLQRLASAAPSPLPLGVSRWVGRLKRAIVARDADEVARLLAGASLLADDLRGGAANGAARERVLSWLGSLAADTQGVARVTDRTLLEVAREQLAGVERSGVERRYLVDLADGVVYREERAPSAPTASLGPCPRLLTVWLATVEQGAAPRRLRLLQYAVTPLVEPEAWRQVAARAARDFDALLSSYREALRAFPGMCEPFAVVAPASVEHGMQPVLLDGAGRRLHLSHPENPAALRHLDELTSAAEPLWVAGRLIDRDGILTLAPLGAALQRGGRVSYAQM